KFESKPLEFMKFEMGTIDSNLYQIYSKTMELLHVAPSNISPLTLSSIIYESEICYILVKEITDSAVLMAVAKNKKPEVFSSIIQALTGEDFEKLKKFLRNSDI
ncbi:MAG: hypothetical protein ACFFAN_14890, partial [Promethearchaeota archaeon]